MSSTLVLPDLIDASIRQAARNPLETAGVILATHDEAPDGGMRLLARAIFWVDEAAYLQREADRLSIASEGYVPALAIAEQLGAVPIWFHTHPGDDGVPRPSVHDEGVDREIADLFRLRSGSPYYGTLIVSPRGEALAFTGSLCPENGPPVPIDRIWSIGAHWRLVLSFDGPKGEVSPIFDRNVRAFGGAVQATLSDLTIGVVGAGGTGSAVAEQLVRLGVRRLLLMDPDTLSASNVTRVYGSTPADVGRSKTEVLREHLTRIAPNLACETETAMVTLEASARRLVRCDLVFGCTDDNGGRLVLSRFASFMLTPVIDVGVLLSSDASGALCGIDGRITILAPGSACLVCRGRVDLARAAAELRTPAERRRLEDEGYAPALDGIEPAVVAFTSAVAAAAVGELLERLIGYGPVPRPSEILLRLHEREISTNIVLPQPGHYCDRAAGKLGAGGAAPFLEQVWPQT